MASQGSKPIGYKNCFDPSPSLPGEVVQGLEGAEGSTFITTKISRAKHTIGCPKKPMHPSPHTTTQAGSELAGQIAAARTHHVRCFPLGKKKQRGVQRGGGYCHECLKWALAVRGTVAGRRLGAREGGTSPTSNASLPPPPPL